MNEQPLTPSAFYVLLALHQGERHGYEIMKQVESASSSKIKMGPGTMYGLIKRLLAEELIEESDDRPDPSKDDERRRYYRLTAAGKRRLGAELQRYEQAVTQAQELGINFRTLTTKWAV
jgi:DNA-binding PadR family transcriptional regulator